jgi:hypothetical protein
MPVEILLYGVLCSISALCGIPALMNRDDGVYALVGGMIMSLFWCANAMLWMSNGVELFAFVDGGFFVATVILWWFTRLRWVGLLALLFLGNLGLDALFLKAFGINVGMTYPWFSRASNLLFISELATVAWVGWSQMQARMKIATATLGGTITVALGLISFGIF